MATESRPVDQPASVQMQERNVAIQKGAPVLTPSRRTRPVTPAAREADTVQVWPHLVVIEFLAAIIFTINLVLLGTLVNGILLTMANPEQTPNPSKAPWYFLNLQELLLHMNPALAGVIVPTVALVALAAIPYIDKGTRGLGVWFYSKRGPAIVIFCSVYTTIILFALIFFDALVKPRDLFQSWTAPGNWLYGVVQWLAFGGDEAAARGTFVEAIIGWIWPTIAMLFFIAVLVFLLRLRWRDINLSEIIVGLFSGFVATYVVLTFVGTTLRGEGMQLFWPWVVIQEQLRGAGGG